MNTGAGRSNRLAMAKCSLPERLDDSKMGEPDGAVALLLVTGDNQSLVRLSPHGEMYCNSQVRPARSTHRVVLVGTNPEKRCG